MKEIFDWVVVLTVKHTVKAPDEESAIQAAEEGNYEPDSVEVESVECVGEACED